MTPMSSSQLLMLARRQRDRLHAILSRRAFSDLLATSGDLANARWELRRCGAVGPCTRVRGRVYVRNRGDLRIDEWCLLESTVTPISLLVHKGAELAIGAHSYLNFGVCIESRRKVFIGPRCHLGQYVHIMDNDQHAVDNHSDCPDSEPVVLEEGVWLGAQTLVLKGVTIGRGTTVGAGSVVTRSLPPHCVAAGAPARVIRRLDDA